MKINTVIYWLAILYSAYLILRSILILSSFGYLEYEDFNHYYSTAYLVLEGETPYRKFFEDIPLSYYFSYNSKILQATNPPLLALFTAPLALLPPFNLMGSWFVILALGLMAILLSFYTFLQPGWHPLEVNIMNLPHLMHPIAFSLNYLDHSNIIAQLASSIAAISLTGILIFSTFKVRRNGPHC